MGLNAKVFYTKIFKKLRLEKSFFWGGEEGGIQIFCWIRSLQYRNRNPVDPTASKTRSTVCLLLLFFTRKVDQSAEYLGPPRSSALHQHVIQPATK